MVKSGLICGISGNPHKVSAVKNNLYAKSKILI